MFGVGVAYARCVVWDVCDVLVVGCGFSYDGVSRCQSEVGAEADGSVAGGKLSHHYVDCIV